MDIIKVQKKLKEIIFKLNEINYSFEKMNKYKVKTPIKKKSNDLNKIAFDILFSK